MFDWLKQKLAAIFPPKSSAKPWSNPGDPFQRSHGSRGLRPMKAKRRCNRSREVMARVSRMSCYSTRRKK